MTRYTKSGNVSTVPEINSELEQIGTSIADLLSRKGDTPNEMLSTLDMNNNRIINLPAPQSPNEPLRFIDAIGGIAFSVDTDEALIFDNINEMKLADLVVGQYVRCKRYYAGGDLVDGLEYEIQATTTVDGYLDHLLSNNNIARLKRKRVLQVLQAGGVDDNSTNNDVYVQACIDGLSVLEDKGGTIEVDRYCQFNIRNLTFREKQNLVYFLGDEKSNTQSSTKNTNERVLFMANANPFGIVNEEQVSASFHPGHSLESRKDVLGHDAYLGTAGENSQNRLEPARASYNIRDEKQAICRIVYENYALSNNIFSGWRMQNFTYLVNITGIGSDSFSVPPVKGDRINGINTGSHGILYEITPTTMTLVWTYREFEVGERLNDGVETTTDTISTVSITIRENQSLRQSRTEGNWTVGLPAENPNLNPYLWGVGGKQINSIPRTAGQNLPPEMSLTETGYCWADNMELPTPNGYEIVYDTSVTVAKRRLELKALGDSKAIGAVGLNFASTIVQSTLALPFSSLNIASITKPSTGNYTVTFTNEANRADYRVQTGVRKITTGMADLMVQVFNKTTTSCSIRVYTLSTGALVNLDANTSIDIDFFGGDI